MGRSQRMMREYESLFYGSLWVASPPKMPAKPAQPHLVPVRLGGPWRYRGVHWEVWRDGVFSEWVSTSTIFGAPDGRMQYKEPDGTWHEALHHSIKNAEIRPPLGWTGDLPEGCCWATDFLVGQRVQDKLHRRNCGVVRAINIVGTLGVECIGGAYILLSTEQSEGY